MAQLEITSTIMAVGKGRAVYLPAWFCRQLKISVGQSFTLTPNPKNGRELQLSLGSVKKSLDKR